MNKKHFIISFVIILLIASLFVLRQEITNKIQKKVIDNTIFTDNPEVIKKEIERLDRAIKLNPKKYLYHATRAQLHTKINDYASALSDFDNIHKFKKNYAEGYFSQGIIYDWIGKADSASIYYEKAENIYNSRIESEEDSALIQNHKLNIFVLNMLQGDSVSILDYESDTLSINYQMLKEWTNKSKTEILKEMLN